MTGRGERLARALALVRGGDGAGAARLIEGVLAEAPDDVDALHLMAAVKRQAREPVAALAFFDRAAALAPRAAPIVFNRANLLAEIGRFEEALAGYDAALALRPDHGETWLNRARAHAALMRWGEALAGYERAAALGVAQGARERCGALVGLERYEEALTCFEARLSADERDADALYNRARCLQELGRLDEALGAYERAAAHEPDKADIHHNRGVLLYWLGRSDEALGALDAALVLTPDDGEVLYTKGVTLLAAGALAQGWPLHEKRRDPAVGLAMRDHRRGEPEWRGQALAGALRIWSEQGIGEEILFARLAPLARARASHVVLECAERLVPLLARAFPELEVRAVEAGEGAPRAGAQIAAGSLGAALTLGVEHLNGGAAYLAAHAGLSAAMRARYQAAARGRPIVGLAWVSKNARYGVQKSSALDDWGALLSKDCYFVDLQYGEHSEELAAACARFGCEVLVDAEVDQMANLEAFAAQIAALDLVITVSNTTAHMAGALGVPTLVLVPPAQGLLWYWGARGEATPWYASVRLVRRAPGQSWADQVAAAAALIQGAFQSN